MHNNDIQALIFDFDGLIIDSESTDFEAWKQLYQRYGVEFTFEAWAEGVGSSLDLHDPYAILQRLAGPDADARKIEHQHRKIWEGLTSRQPLLPGVRQIIDQAQAMGLRLAIASSAQRSWISRHLERFGLQSRFDCLCTAQDVAHSKPEPDLFLKALYKLQIDATQAIVLEDSPNGILAAKRAGVFAVAVPNPMTRHLPLEGADAVIESLADLSLADLLALPKRLAQTRG